MNYFIFSLGAILVVLVIADVLISTLAPRGSGFITERLRSGVWNFFFWVCRGKGTNKLLNYAGMFTITAWLAGWILTLWVGNALIYISDYKSVLVSGANTSAGALEKFYFVGYVLSTMGNGDFQPHGDGWRIYTSIISFFGFIIITLAITYLVPVLSAEMGKRKASIYIHSLGTSPDDILLNAWNGRDFSNLTQHFSNISEFIMEQAQQHVAYPILHNFHSHLHRESLYINLTALDEALTILLLYLPDYIQPHKQAIYPLRFAITDFLNTLQEAFINPSDNLPGPIPLDKLKEYNIPLKQENADIRMNLERLRLRRKLLLGMLENDGWAWGHISMKSDYSAFDIEHIKKINELQTKEYQEGDHR